MPFCLLWYVPFSLLIMRPRYCGWLSFLPFFLVGVYMDAYCFPFLWSMWMNGLAIFCCSLYCCCGKNLFLPRLCECNVIFVNMCFVVWIFF